MKAFAIPCQRDHRALFHAWTAGADSRLPQMSAIPRRRWLLGSEKDVRKGASESSQSSRETTAGQSTVGSIDVDFARGNTFSHLGCSRFRKFYTCFLFILECRSGFLPRIRGCEQPAPRFRPLGGRARRAVRAGCGMRAGAILAAGVFIRVTAQKRHDRGFSEQE